MNIIFRVNASSEIGLGHLIRCLCLAKVLYKQGYNIFFICNKLHKNIAGLIADKPYKLIFLNYSCNNIDNKKSCELKALNTLLQEIEHVSLLIIDDYNIDFRIESKFRLFVDKIMVIDDLANRKHDCDFFLDQNYYANLESRYNHKIPNRSIKLLGPKYALLREDFKIVKQRNIKRAYEFNNILITMGGADPNNITERILEILFFYRVNNNYEFNLRVIIGPGFHSLKFADKYKGHSWIEILNSPNMSEQFIWADYCIGCSGSTIWERCYLGLPSVIVIDGDNERELAYSCQSLGIVNCIENDDRLEENLIHILNEINTLALKKMSKRCENIVDGLGAIRVANLINKEIKGKCQI